jgi:hypothetical protein
MTPRENARPQGGAFMSRKYLLFLPLAALLLGRAPAALGQPAPTRVKIEAQDIEASLGTDWFGVYLKGKKVGYQTSTRKKVGEGADIRYIEETRTSMKLVSLGQKSKLDSTETTEFEARPPYRLRRAERTESDGTVVQEIRCVATDKGFDVTLTTGKETRRKHVPAPDFTLEDALGSDVWLRRGPKPGEKITVRELDIEELKTELVTDTLVATKTSLAHGVEVIYHELETLMHKVNLKGLVRSDVKANVLSATFAGVFELRRESEADAKNTEYSADVFVLGMAKIDKKLGRTKKVAGLVVDVPAKEAAFLKSASRQKAVANPPGGVTLKIGKAHADLVKATAAEIEENLAETTAYPIGLPKVKALARRAVGDAETTEEKVRRLVKFVHHYVKPSLAAGVPRLQDLIERKSGDCKSYALLFTALARAAGVPARELGGLLYMGDDVKAFGGHAWNEVVIDGFWVPIDASLNEAELDAAHISFGDDRDATANLLNTLGKLSFRLVEVERRK